MAVNAGGAFGHLPFGAITADKMKAEAERQKKMKKIVKPVETKPRSIYD